MSSKDACAMHSRSGNIEIMNNNEADEAIKELCESYRSRYRIGEEQSLKSSDFLIMLIYCITNAIK